MFREQFGYNEVLFRSMIVRLERERVTPLLLGALSFMLRS